MNSNNIMFLYPCLKSKPIDYKQSTINFLINQSVYNTRTEEVQVYFSHDIDSKYMKKLMEQKKVSAYIKIYAPESNYLKYEKIVFLNRNKYLNLNAKEIFGKTYLSLVLVTDVDIANFSCDEFEFAKNYQVEKNSIVGFSQDVEIDITKDDLVHESISSIFTINESDLYTGSNIKYNLDSDKIVIMCPKGNVYGNIEKLSQRVNYIPVVYQLIITPALVHAILNIDDNRYVYYRWNKLLKIKLDNIDTVNITYEKALLIVQKLLNNPFEKTLENLAFVKEYDE